MANSGPVRSGPRSVSDDPGLLDAYIAHLVASLGTDSSLEGIRIVIDCAHGAASVTGPSAFAAQGAEVIAIHAEPDGLNINDGVGSTHLEKLQQAVVEHRAHLGIALDGDADRCLAVDADGHVVDGDQILAILALMLRERQELGSNTVVATVMSNLGFVNAMREHGIRVDQTKVGDRYVLESMNANGFTLGGDGVLTGLHMTARMARTGKSLAELASVMTRLPQAMVNVSGVDKLRAGSDLEIKAAITAASHALGDSGRVLLRPSGTEPVVRVMAEAPTQEQAQQICDQLAAVVTERAGL